MGGHDGHNRLKSLEVYVPEKNQWTLLANMSVKRSDADACTINGKIYIIGLFVIKCHCGHRTVFKVPQRPPFYTK